MYNKYIFQDGGETDQNDDFFKNYVQNITQQQGDPSFDNTENLNHVQDEPEENDYIKNLRARSEEEDSEKPNFNQKLQEAIGQLSDHYDEKINQLTQMLNLTDFYGSEEGKNYMSAMYDTQNPNVQYHDGHPPIASNNPGALMRPGTTSLQAFSSPEEGRTALVNQLMRYQAGKTNRTSPDMSLYDAMEIYAPKGHGNNNPKAYAEFIGKKLGISPNTPISQVNTNKWADAITQQEGLSSPTSSLKFSSSGKQGLSNIGEQGIKIGNELSDMLGYKPIYNSIYRTPEQQKQYIEQGIGAKNSYHLTGNAIDMTPKDWNNLSSKQQSQIKHEYRVFYHNNHYHIQPK